MKEMPPQCPRCRKRMEPGYLVDHGHGIVYPTAWVEGVPRWSSWFGLRIKRKQKLPVTSFRCPQCGVLESFAHPGPWPA